MGVLLCVLIVVTIILVWRKIAAQTQV